jgi:drug/metabolite transporter (DMT)-like permease
MVLSQGRKDHKQKLDKEIRNYRYVNSSLVAIIASSTALWIMALDVPMWKKNFSSPLAITGIVGGLVGVLMLYIEQHKNESLDQAHSFGILILLFGCISWALGTLYAKYFFWRDGEKHSFGGSAWQMIFASAMFWITAFVSGEIGTVQLSNVSGQSWLSLTYLVFFGSILAYSAYIWLLRIRPATEVGTHAYVNPFIAVFLGKTLGDEQVSLTQLTGLVLIVTSIVLVNLKGSTSYQRQNTI